MIVPGSASQELAVALARELDRPLAAIEYDRFPDGELLVTVDGMAADPPAHAIVVAATVDSDAHLELLLLQDACREAGVERVTTVIPYLGYARQDAAFEAGQPVSARAVAAAIAAGTDRVLTVTPHEPGILDHFPVPATAVEGADRLAEPLPADLERPVFLAPDEGAIHVAERVRDAYEGEEAAVDHLVKSRRSGTEVEIAPSDVDVADRDLVLVDDIIATGSTMSEAIALLRGRGPRRIIVGCVHPLLVGGARARLANAGVSRVYGTDTIERAISAVSVAPAIADALASDG